MGAQASTRKITLVDDDAQGVIKISEDVVKRLRGEGDPRDRSRATVNETKEVIKPKPSLIPAPPPPPKEELQKEIRKPILRSNKDKDNEIRRVEEYWKEKMNAVELRALALQQFSVEQFNAALKDVEAKFGKQTCREPVCEDLQKQVIQCYQNNPKQTLNCSPEVRHFTDCVDKMRMKTLSRGA